MLHSYAIVDKTKNACTKTKFKMYCLMNIGCLLVNLAE